MRRGQRFMATYEVIGGEGQRSELADGQQRPVDGQRRDNGVDAVPLGQTGIHARAAFINAPSQGRNDAVDDVAQVGLIFETNLRRRMANDAFLLDKDAGITRQGRARCAAPN